MSRQICRQRNESLVRLLSALCLASAITACRGEPAATQGDTPTHVSSTPAASPVTSVTPVSQTDSPIVGADTRRPGNRQEAEAADRRAGELLSRGDREGALRELDRANLADPTYADAYRHRGILFHRDGNYDAAIREYDKWVQLQRPRDLPEALVERGNTLLAMDRLDAAMRDYQQAVRLKPKYGAPHLNIALVHKRRDNLAAALDALDRGLALNPNYARLYVERGLIFMRQGLLREADMELRFGYGLDPKLRGQYADQVSSTPRGVAPSASPVRSVKQLLIEGVRLAAHDQARDALRHFDGAARTEPRNADAVYLRGKAYLDLRQYERSVEDLSQAVSLMPTFSEAYRFRGRAYQGLNDIDAALRDLNRALETNPQSAPAYLDRAAFYRRYKPNLAATMLRDLDRAVQLAPADPAAHNARGAVLLESGDVPAALHEFDEALRLWPAYADALGNRGFAKYRQGSKAEGVEDINRAIKLKPMLFYFYEDQLPKLDRLPEFERWFEQLRAFAATAWESSGSDACSKYVGPEARACKANDWWALDRGGIGY